MSSFERLNYIAGQRLNASDLKLEADYFITVRRLINQGLFAPGVLTGLEVAPKKSGRDVTISPGLAIDPQGREMYVPAEVTMTIPASRPKTSLGYCLVIRYNEVSAAPQANSCGVSTATPANTRIDELPWLEFTETWPNQARCVGNPACSPAAADCAVVLALVTMDPSCNVKDVVTGVRQYAYPRNATQVQALSFTGEQNIDYNNSKKLYFHCRRGTPNAVWLYLRGGRFSTLHYSELGSHAHAVSVVGTTDTETEAIPIDHTHETADVPTGSSETQPASTTKHRHQLYAYVHDYIGLPHSVRIDNNYTGSQWDDGLPTPWVEDRTLDHTHLVPGQSTKKSSLSATVPPTHDHAFTAPSETDASGATDPTGSNASDARQGSMLSYLNGMTVWLGTSSPVDITDLVLSQINDLNWGSPPLKLGDGTATHPFNTFGTGAIDLYRLIDVTTSDGEHLLEFKVDGPGGGGKVMWELYIE